MVLTLKVSEECGDDWITFFGIEFQGTLVAKDEDATITIQPITYFALRGSFLRTDLEDQIDGIDKQLKRNGQLAEEYEISSTLSDHLTRYTNRIPVATSDYFNRILISNRDRSNDAAVIGYYLACFHELFEYQNIDDFLTLPGARLFVINTPPKDDMSKTQVELDTLLFLFSSFKQEENSTVWWLKRRDAFLASVSRIGFPCEDGTADIKTLSAFWNGIDLDIRARMFETVLFGQGTYMKNVRDYMFALSSWAEATTFHQSYIFAINCETEVHTLEPICTQSEYVINCYNDLVEEHGPRASYCKLLNLEGTTNMQTSHFKDLAYAAVEHNKIEQGMEGSWNRYAKISSTMSRVITDKLQHKLIVASTSSANSEVNRYLKAHGRTVAKGKEDDEHYLEKILKLIELSEEKKKRSST